LVGGQVDHFPALVADLAGRRDRRAWRRHRAALAAKAATTIPIVFSVGSDPVEQGLVASLGHPGGNLTGSTVLAQELTAKTLELLRSTAAATSVGFLIDPPMPYPNVRRQSSVQPGGRECGGIEAKSNHGLHILLGSGSAHF
jgi:putative tryptophan/tyrosine transport system substrate-binding protein